MELITTRDGGWCEGGGRKLVRGVPGPGYRTGCRRREGSRNNGPKGSLGTIINKHNALVDEQNSIKYGFGFVWT